MPMRIDSALFKGNNELADLQHLISMLMVVSREKKRRNNEVLVQDNESKYIRKKVLEDD